MSDFSIHDIKTVDELYDPREVNLRLKKGWVLLAVGFNTEDETPCKVYILGNVKTIEPNVMNSDDRLTRLRNE